MPRKATAAVIATLSIDIGKNVFHLIGLNNRGAIVLRQGYRQAAQRRMVKERWRHPGVHWVLLRQEL